MGGWRQPLLMVDRIDDFKYGENGYVKVIKHVTYNEPYLLGHFPEDPIMPGLLFRRYLARLVNISLFCVTFAIFINYAQGENFCLCVISTHI